VTRPLSLLLPLLAGCGSTADVFVDDDTGLGACEGSASNAEAVVCTADAFLASLSDAEVASVQYAWDDTTSKTLWSNLPPAMVPRAGLQFGDLSDTSRAAAYTVARAALSDAGYADFKGVLAADDYLNANGGGSDYGSVNYSIAFFGTPSVDGDWMLMIGGHHMAWLITYEAGVGYPTPNHLGSEPKSSFTLNGVSYSPVSDEGAAFEAIFAGMFTDELASARLTGQVFGDVLLGPDEYGTGSSDAVNYPTGTDRGGVAVSTLSSAEQAKVVAAVEAWVDDFDPEVSDTLMTAYTSDDDLADTLVAWAGSTSAGPDVDVSGTYFRIDGPRLWIELACQGGIVIQGQTHFHTIYRDKQTDYGGEL
jgi:hypothetical protein